MTIDKTIKNIHEELSKIADPVALAQREVGLQTMKAINRAFQLGVEVGKQLPKNNLTPTA